MLKIGIMALSKMKEGKQEAEEEACLDISPEFVIADEATTACLHTAKIKSSNRRNRYLGDKPLPFLWSLAG